MGAVGDPFAVLVAQPLGPGLHALLLHRSQLAKPRRQALFHAFGTAGDLLGQRCIHIQLLPLADVLAERITHLRHLGVAHAT
ncbi:hypothetical protein D9M71_706590 [compost metagenome]